jgi:hypothetical protein
LASTARRSRPWTRAEVSSLSAESRSAGSRSLPRARVRLRFSSGGRIVSRPAPGAVLPHRQAIHLFSLTVDGLHVVHSFERREGEKRRLWAREGVRRAELVHSFPTPRHARTSPQTPGQARRRPLSRAPLSVERRLHLAKVVEGMMLSARFLSIGRGWGVRGQQHFPGTCPCRNARACPHTPDQRIMSGGLSGSSGVPKLPNRHRLSLHSASSTPGGSWWVHFPGLPHVHGPSPYGTRLDSPLPSACRGV